MVLLALFLACGESNPPPDKVVVVSGAINEHADIGQGAPFDVVAFECCDSPEATAVVQAFVGLAEAMADDDATATAERLDGFRQAAAGAEPLAGALAALPGQDLASLHKGFSPLADATITYARAHRGGSSRVAVAYCPMAPGRWLQAGAEIRNPYYGSEMLRCGVFEALPE